MTEDIISVSAAKLAASRRGAASPRPDPSETVIRMTNGDNKQIKLDLALKVSRKAQKTAPMPSVNPRKLLIINEN
jgi:hypothetical protein